MTTSDQTAEALFERTLLDSARNDELSSDGAERAWADFAHAASLLTGESAASQSAARPASSTPYRHAAGWLVVGALAGGLATMTWLGGGGQGGPPPGPTNLVGPAGVAPVAPLGLGAQEPPPVKPAQRLRATTVARSTALPSTSLAAEVRAIDAARAALFHREVEDALDRLARYRRDFPRGELRSDAAVVRLEALAAKGDRATLARQAAIFFEQHPNDAHAALVRRLLRE